MAKQNEQQEIWSKIVARALADEDYKQRLLDDPATVLSEEGMQIPADTKINVVETTKDQAWFVLPLKAEVGINEELSDETLNKIAEIGRAHV